MTFFTDKETFEESDDPGSRIIIYSADSPIQYLFNRPQRRKYLIIRYIPTVPTAQDRKNQVISLRIQHLFYALHIALNRFQSSLPYRIGAFDRRLRQVVQLPGHLCNTAVPISRFLEIVIAQQTDTTADRQGNSVLQGMDIVRISPIDSGIRTVFCQKSVYGSLILCLCRRVIFIGHTEIIQKIRVSGCGNQVPAGQLALFIRILGDDLKLFLSGVKVYFKITSL